MQDLIKEEIHLSSHTRADEKVIIGELHEHIKQVVDKLPPQRQLVFKLSREEHLNYDQIAKHLNLSKSTIKNHMVHALQFMREHINANLDTC